MTQQLVHVVNTVCQILFAHVFIHKYKTLRYINKQRFFDCSIHIFYWENFPDNISEIYPIEETKLHRRYARIVNNAGCGFYLLNGVVYVPGVNTFRTKLPYTPCQRSGKILSEPLIYISVFKPIVQFFYQANKGLHFSPTSVFAQKLYNLGLGGGGGVVRKPLPFEQHFKIKNLDAGGGIEHMTQLMRQEGFVQLKFILSRAFAFFRISSHIFYVIAVVVYGYRRPIRPCRSRIF